MSNEYEIIRNYQCSRDCVEMMTNNSGDSPFEVDISGPGIRQVVILVIEAVKNINNFESSASVHAQIDSHATKTTCGGTNMTNMLIE